MSRIFHRHTQAELPVAVRGEGLWIIDREGRVGLLHAAHVQRVRVPSR